MKLQNRTRKKLRGSRRHALKVGEWLERNSSLSHSCLDASGLDYARLHIDPFDRLPPAALTIPAWLERKMVSAVIETALRWQSQLKLRREPRDLQIWLFPGASFMNSQIVATVGEKRLLYEEKFDLPEHLSKFPQRWAGAPGVDEMKWQQRRWLDEMLVEDWNDWLAHPGPAKRKQIERKFVRAFARDGQELVEVEHAPVWVGRFKD